MGIKAEYIWVDGTVPTNKLRSKMKVLDEGTRDLPLWGFDGANTSQATGQDSDCILEPVFSCPDPIRGGGNMLVLCEVLAADGEPHETNSRALLRSVAERFEAEEPLFGIEQEFTMFMGAKPLGWPKSGYPAPAGPFYCGVGSDEVFGRAIMESHMEALLGAGLRLAGVNAGVMPGQWKFQIGTAGPLDVSDHLLIARWLLYRLGEEHGITMSLDPKPIRGEWKGAGAHTNFSTKTMRADGGIKAISRAIEKLEADHEHHIENYGDGIEHRLNGHRETSSFREFTSGVGDRNASIRIPGHVARAGKGFFQDRRPSANIDPYVVTRLLIETICG